MHQDELGKHAGKEDIARRLGKAEDLSPLLELHTANLYDILSEEQRKDGFIKVKYSESDFLAIISHQEIVVASQGNKLIGYYMVACESRSKFLNYQKEKAEEIAVSEPTIEGLANIGYGVQICIALGFRNNGLFKALLAHLCKSVKTKYNVLLCSVSDTNTNSLDKHILGVGN
jgi:hypothetical protein